MAGVFPVSTGVNSFPSGRKSKSTTKKQNMSTTILCMCKVKGQLTFLITSLRKMISVSFIVKSSSLVPDFKSLTTEGRMQSGGTRRRVRIMSEGLPDSGFIKSRGISSAGILFKRFRTTKGFRFSCKRQKIYYYMVALQGKESHAPLNSNTYSHPQSPWIAFKPQESATPPFQGPKHLRPLCKQPWCRCSSVLKGRPYFPTFKTFTLSKVIVSFLSPPPRNLTGSLDLGALPKQF